MNHNSVFDPAPDFLRAARIVHVRTFSPLELVVTAILVAVHMDHRTNEQLLEDVKEMRLFLRKKHKDLRVNAQCWNTAWSFITKEMDVRLSSSSKLHLSIEGRRPGEGQSSSATSGRDSSGADGSERGSSPLSSAPSSEPEVVPVVRSKKKVKPKPGLKSKSKTKAKMKIPSQPPEKLKAKGKAKRKPLPTGPSRGKIIKNKAANTTSKKKSRPAEKVSSSKKARRADVDVVFDSL